MDSTFLIVKERLLSIIREQRFENNKLYSEEMLVKILDASRGTVREVLRSLARQGVITKKHGIGNFVHPRTLSMKMRIDEIQDFIQLIQDGGYEAVIKKDGEPFLYSLPEESSGDSFEKYLEKNMEYYCFSRIYLADQQPAAYCRLFFPKNLFSDLPSGEVGYSNIFKFVKANFKQEIDQTLVWISTETANELHAEKLQVPLGSALLVWDELHCNYRDQVIAYSKTYFNTTVVNISILKKSS